MELFCKFEKKFMTIIKNRKSKMDEFNQRILNNISINYDTDRRDIEKQIEVYFRMRNYLIDCT